MSIHIARLNRKAWERCIVVTAFLAGVPVANAQTLEWITPDAGPGPAIVIVSGASGVAPYREFGQKISAMGYTAVLIDGNEVSILGAHSATNFSNVLKQIQTDQRATKGKIAIVGFSMGGGGALAHATSQSDTVAAVSVFYPAVSVLPNPADTANGLKVPTLIFAGGLDRLNNCCLVESARDFVKIATAGGGDVVLVEYPQANHAFNLRGPSFRESDTEDSWNRLRTFINAHLPFRR